MAINPTYPLQYVNNVTNITADNTTQAKVAVGPNLAGLVASISGETALPDGETGVRQRVLQGGCRIIDGSISSTDGTARTAIIWTGVQMSLYANMGTVTTTATTNATNTRNSGSFITDGWTVGDSAMIFGSATSSNNGVLAVVTTVATSTLTYSGVPSGFSAVTEGAGFYIAKVGLWTQRTIPINSGNTGSAPSVVLLGGTQDPARAPLPDSGLTLGPSGLLIFASTATISAKPATLSLAATYGMY